MRSLYLECIVCGVLMWVALTYMNVLGDKL